MWLNRILRSLFMRSGASAARSATSHADGPGSSPHLEAAWAVPSQTQCLVCAGTCRLLDGVDFNKSCEEARGKYLPLSGLIVYYYVCEQCGFCFAPEFSGWSQDQFQQEIYNDEYVHVDPDYVDVRPRSNAAALISLLGNHAAEITHLDYGGGGGLLSALLRDANWQSTSYDPFPDQHRAIDRLGRFDLITAFEVFEHVPDVQALMSRLSLLLAQPGLVLFSTLLSDDHVKPEERMSWWYAAPRNGHVSLFSRQSLAVLGSTHGFSFGSLSENFHAFWKEVPDWATNLFQMPRHD